MEAMTIDQLLSDLIAKPGEQTAASQRNVIIETQAMMSALAAVLIRARLTDEKELGEIRDACRQQVIEMFKGHEAAHAG